MATDAAEARATGFFCSTSGTYFSDKESLAEHYRSDFHRYNLKRKVAGLPPVTKEWFEARKAQLASAAAAPTQRVWYDPLTRRKFMSEAKYKEATCSKKYAELVRRSGAPAPAPVVMLKRLDGGDAAAAPGGGGGGAPAGPARLSPGFVAKAPARPAAAASSAAATAGSEDSEEGDEYEVEGGEGWETASADDDDAGGDEGAAGGDALAAAAAGLSLGVGRRPAAARRGAAAPRAAAGEPAAASGSGSDSGDDGDWQEWDVRRSLFDNRVSGSMQDNLEYMFKHFGFYLPDAEFLNDPEGLLRYLGSKLQYGKVALYTRGDDPGARQFRSLHAVQRHMVDANRCKMVYDDNEDEYADFYDYSPQYAGDAAGDAEGEGEGEAGAVVAASGGGGAAFAAAGLEMVVGGAEGAAGSKVLGSRWLARYYKQRPRPAAARPPGAGALGAPPSAAAAGVVAQYRALGVETRAPEAIAAARRAQRAVRRGERSRLNLAMKANILHNLPKNCTF
ncbi:MAG: hypothetical protein J3K34DRAFT_522329 [Monoraphidium minutum]|nr:MAG: hypothetical protein J3K34DRAFT_522329 [Monoraphidium minutum]